MNGNYIRKKGKVTEIDELKIKFWIEILGKFIDLKNIFFIEKNDA